jgi:hypothetical protein
MRVEEAAQYRDILAVLQAVGRTRSASASVGDGFLACLAVGHDVSSSTTSPASAISLTFDFNYQPTDPLLEHSSQLQPERYRR